MTKKMFKGVGNFYVSVWDDEKNVQGRWKFLCFGVRWRKNVQGRWKFLCFGVRWRKNVQGRWKFLCFGVRWRKNVQGRWKFLCFGVRWRKNAQERWKFLLYIPNILHNTGVAYMARVTPWRWQLLAETCRGIFGMYNKNVQRPWAFVGHLTPKHKMLGPTIKISTCCVYESALFIRVNTTLWTQCIYLYFATFRPFLAIVRRITITWHNNIKQIISFTLL
jgi:hypothetical protein